MEQLNKWRLSDIIMVGILGVVFALIYLGALYAGIATTAALTPLGLAPFGYEIFYGIWFMGASLSAYIIQKPGVAFITEILAAFLELLMGNIGGPLVLVAGAVQGLGSEAGFAMFRYKRFDMGSMIFSGVFATLFSFVWGFVQNAYALLTPGIVAMMLIIRLVSALLFATVLSKFAGDSLAKTGVLKGYPLGARRGAPRVMRDENE